MVFRLFFIKIAIPVTRNRSNINCFVVLQSSANKILTCYPFNCMCKDYCPANFHTILFTFKYVTQIFESDGAQESFAG